MLRHFLRVCLVESLFHVCFMFPSGVSFHPVSLLISRVLTKFLLHTGLLELHRFEGFWLNSRLP
jgi:hypothetical protein